MQAQNIVSDSDQHTSGTPYFLFRPAHLLQSFDCFRRGFPGEVTYAVKANPAPEVLATLASAGMRAFDVASVEEMTLVRQIAPKALLHYHNPVRSRSEIQAARRMSVLSWSVDRMSELDKLGTIAGLEIAVRLKLETGGAAYDFGSKFGATPDEAEVLLRQVALRGGRPSITFHPGTQCNDPRAWVAYIQAAGALARRAQIGLHRLNVGGGFAAQRGREAPDLRRTFDAIGQAAQSAFCGAPPPLVCEPGRALVAEAMELVLQVKAVSGDTLFLNDGIYGALAEWRDIGAPGRLSVLSPQGEERRALSRPWHVFGPTCDSLDRLEAPLALPGDVAEGDSLHICGMGAYTASLVTQFNGYGTKTVHRIA